MDVVRGADWDLNSKNYTMYIWSIIQKNYT